MNPKGVRSRHPTNVANIAWALTAGHSKLGKCTVSKNR